MRRFLTHVVPPSFCRLRHYGFLGNRVKKERLQRCRTLLGGAATVAEIPREPVALLLHLTGMDVSKCPQCKEGTAFDAAGDLGVPACWLLSDNLIDLTHELSPGVPEEWDDPYRFFRW